MSLKCLHRSICTRTIIPCADQYFLKIIVQQTKFSRNFGSPDQNFRDSAVGKCVFPTSEVHVFHTFLPSFIKASVVFFVRFSWPCALSKDIVVYRKCCSIKQHEAPTLLPSFLKDIKHETAKLHASELTEGSDSWYEKFVFVSQLILWWQASKA